jgi:hypothetical protein
MRKSIVTETKPGAAKQEQEGWLDLEEIATAELTSEDPQFPFEHAIGKNPTSGWRAADPGPQTIRLVFDTPQTIRKIHLHFCEHTVERNQEFSISAGNATQLNELRRQQWGFSPQGSTEEIEDFDVNLPGITVLEIKIDPDRSHDPKQSKTHASLQHLRLA